MKSFAAVAAFVAAANAYAYNTTAPPTYETITTSAYTTVCPGPTEIPIAPGSTITVTEATTLTITDCPCTITKPVETPSYAPAPVVPSSAPAPYYPPGNSSSTAPAPSGTAPTSVYPTGTPSPSEFPGAAGKTGLSLLAVAGALAAFL